MNRSIAAILLGVALAAPALAQAPPPPPAPGQKKEEPPVTVKALLDAEAIRPGETFRVALVFTMGKGFHVYGGEGKDEDVVRTRVKPPKIEGIQWEPPMYPKPVEKKIGDETFQLYEGTVVVIVKGKAAPTLASGPTALEFEVAYQACTDEYCLPPHPNDSTTLKTRVAKAGETVKPANEEIFAEKKTDAKPKNGG
jgi:DsbC/DsbD-like thiol-disulfide interchange protein